MVLLAPIKKIIKKKKSRPPRRRKTRSTWKENKSTDKYCALPLSIATGSRPHIKFTDGRYLNLSIDNRVIDRKLWWIYSGIYGPRSTVQGVVPTPAPVPVETGLSALLLAATSVIWREKNRLRWLLGLLEPPYFCRHEVGQTRYAVAYGQIVRTSKHERQITRTSRGRIEGRTDGGVHWHRVPPW